MTEADDVTLESELGEAQAAVAIAKAVSTRHSIARKHTMRIRRRRPDATPTDVVEILERHYVTAITAAGIAVTVGTIAADVGIGMIPVAGAVAAGAKSAGTQAARVAAKQAAKGLALGLAKNGAQKAASTVLPAGDEQLQFEITAVFALAIADIHGHALDKDQAHALVYGLSNGQVSQKKIAAMANDVADADPGEVTRVGRAAAGARGDWSHWATTLADSLPGGAAQTLVQTIQTGHLDTVRGGFSDKQQRAIEYGAGALTGGVTRFVFGRDVVEATRAAFPPAPDAFPPHLAIDERLRAEDDGDEDQNRALAAFEAAATATGTWIADAAGTVGSGVASAAENVSRPFRSVDLDGDGIPDEPHALTAVKGAGSAVAGAAGVVGGGIAGLLRRKKRQGDEA